ncbi:hypothetical protein B0H67DRAFT_210886 [Lasiosphaeris hirsuta]|uniref:Uncharacterized protein n=1 Tax=Lasiosphaeris hirsuta TaxID=260670 RepID=A0AA40AS67_9PEZI|nr:hypothetical protein B0H67DRAFT_210886 [Lasiosphaeris hirsuta]
MLPWLSEGIQDYVSKKGGELGSMSSDSATPCNPQGKLRASAQSLVPFCLGVPCLRFAFLCSGCVVARLAEKTTPLFDPNGYWGLASIPCFGWSSAGGLCGPFPSARSCAMVLCSADIVWCDVLRGSEWCCGWVFVLIAPKNSPEPAECRTVRRDTTWLRATRPASSVRRGEDTQPHVIRLACRTTPDPGACSHDVWRRLDSRSPQRCCFLRAFRGTLPEVPWNAKSGIWRCAVIHGARCHALPCPRPCRQGP